MGGAAKGWARERRGTRAHQAAGPASRFPSPARRRLPPPPPPRPARKSASMRSERPAAAIGAADSCRSFFERARRRAKRGDETPSRPVVRVRVGGGNSEMRPAGTADRGARSIARFLAALVTWILSTSDQRRSRAVTTAAVAALPSETRSPRAVSAAGAVPFGRRSARGASGVCGRPASPSRFISKGRSERTAVDRSSRAPKRVSRLPRLGAERALPLPPCARPPRGAGAAQAALGTPSARGRLGAKLPPPAPRYPLHGNPPRSASGSPRRSFRERHRPRATLTPCVHPSPVDLPFSSPFAPFVLRLFLLLVPSFLRSRPARIRAAPRRAPSPPPFFSLGGTDGGSIAKRASVAESPRAPLRKR